MKIFLLLLLPLMTGCKDTFRVKGCRNGWVEFICEYPETDETYTSVAVVKVQRTLIESTKENVWESNDRYSVYNDTNNENVRVAIRQLEDEDSGEYKCVFKPGSSEEEMERKVNLKDVKNECQEPFIQTAYRTAKTTISCRYKGKSKVKFFCKDNGSICENIVSTRSSLRSNGTFNLTESSSSFNMSISNVSSQHAGVYWCGVERKGGRYRAALRNITLKVEDTISNFTRFPTIGQNFTYWCVYSKGQPENQIKFICKGEDPSICEPLVTTEQLKQNTGRFSMEDDKEKGNITITVRDVTSEDTGTYWCGAKTSDKTRSNPFFHRLVMTAGELSDYFMVVRPILK
ncbi:polymeric immunoglobulin receptor-like [Sebastes umbrosus]|uniref:polymeric immunoglobulin receptor-like n=1 Tax=Sebastes umbrosus TaxID=72105 RepID=UPI00189C8C7B|nr:polymeric immunoglobulin receptor-like [Sebastes umbrosus]